MAVDRKDGGAREVSGESKLGRLLETERELEAMLEGVRREAEALIETAKRTAEDRVKRCEAQLEEESRTLRERANRDRDRAIGQIETEAREETRKLDELGDAQIAALARHVLDLVVGPPDSGGSR
jgi:F0F1-type ATP synthase membrane subunit b/b'